MADILTKGHFTRDEWNHLLCLFQHQPFQLSAAPRISACLAAPKRWRKGRKNNQKKTGSWQGGLMQAEIKIPIPTQRRVLKDGKGMLNCTGKLAATDKDQKSLYQQVKSVISTGKLVATEFRGFSEKSRDSKRFRRFRTQSRIWPGRKGFNTA